MFKRFGCACIAVLSLLQSNVICAFNDTAVNEDADVACLQNCRFCNKPKWFLLHDASFVGKDCAPLI